MHVGPFWRMIGGGWLLVGLLGFASPAWAADFSTEAANERSQLIERVLPYWYDTAIDWNHGGYLLCDDARTGRCVPSEKQIVTQARMVWGFATAHRFGLSTPQRDYRKAAAHGVKFLRERMHDPQHGGYYWSVSLEGAPKDPRKRLYGEAFVIYALVEYARAAADPEALANALQLFRELHQHAYDSKNGGWNEHFERNWTPFPPKHPEAFVEVAGYKSANTHLHLMEAFAELYAETKDPEVKRALEESLRLNQEYFYPPDAAKASFHFQPNWSPVTESSSAGLSYGHNVEFAWLMLRAEEVLGRPMSWNHFRNLLDHTLRVGTDLVRGGVYNRGMGDQPATDRDKVWWVQSEMLAALSYAVRQYPDRTDYSDALAKLLLWINSKQTDSRSGIWLDTVTADGTPKSTGLAHNWKANYHDVRALILFVQKCGK